MQGENVTYSPPWGRSRAGDLLPSSGSIQGDPTPGQMQPANMSCPLQANWSLEEQK